MSGENEPTIREEGSGEDFDCPGPENGQGPTLVEPGTLRPTLVGAAGESGPETLAATGFGRFRDVEFLAEGGMGQIHTA